MGEVIMGVLVGIPFVMLLIYIAVRVASAAYFRSLQDHDQRKANGTQDNLASR